MINDSKSVKWATSFSSTNVIQHLINENTQLRDLSVGTLETIKLMPGYNEAIEKLKESLTKEQEEKDGVVEQDTK